MEDGVEVSIVFLAELEARRTPRLAREACGGESEIPRDASEDEGLQPSANAREEVALRKVSNIRRFNIGDRAFVHFPFGQDFHLHEFADPRCGVGVELVDVNRGLLHAASPSLANIGLPVSAWCMALALSRLSFVVRP